MNETTRNVLRWIFVLPGAAITGLLATFPLHWALYLGLAHGETISGVDINPIEYNLYPLVIAVTFVLAGYEIAPNHKFAVSIALTCTWIVSFVALSLLLPAPQVQFGVRGVGSLFGSLLGLLIAWRRTAGSPENSSIIAN
jgi:ABC-type sugar transport system permease subunit